MKAALKLPTAVLLALLAVSCNTPGPDPDLVIGKVPPKGPTTPTPPAEGPPWDFEGEVYVAGGGFSSERDIAKVWVDGVEQALADVNTDLYATSILVAGEDVYLAGYEFNWDVYNGWSPYPTRAVLWKNGAPQPLTDGHHGASASSVVVSDNDVYVAGFESNGIKNVATVWKNGVAQPLGDGTIDSYATAVFVTMDDVYITGYESFGAPSYTMRAILWKNGLPQQLTAGYTANSVFVSGSDVYVAGSGYTHAMIWRNGEAQHFETTSQAAALSIYVTGKDVYVGGFEYLDEGENSYGPAKAMIWKNGIPQPLTTGTENAGVNSIAVVGDDVYAVGYKGDKATIWKNGTDRVLGTGEAKSVFIRE